jgi:hypothetical protein
VAFKASTSSKNKGKSKKEASSEDDDDFDDEAMALLIHKMCKFMKKKDYGARKRRDHMKEHVMRLCFECKSPDHITADCPHKRNDDENEEKKDKKEKKEKKMTFKKKNESGYVVTWDSDCSNDSDDNDSSDDDKRSIKKALASIAIHNKPLLFDTPSTCLMAKPTKVKYDDCESDDCRSDDEENYSKDELIEICDTTRFRPYCHLTPFVSPQIVL